MNSRIAVDPEIQHGKPIIKGTRVPVVRILGGLAGGMSESQVAKDYGVSLEDVRAALAFAGELIEVEEYHLLCKAS